MSWQPISAEQIQDRIKTAEVNMGAPHRRFWETIRITPEKWALHPYGDNGNGFWVVAILGRVVVWFNDIEDGFNYSSYRNYGRIDDYACNQDDLEIPVRQLLSIIEHDHPLGPAARSGT